MSQSSTFSRSNVSRYIQLSTLFRRKIEKSEWPVGCQIPTVEDLSKEYQVARATVRQALNVIEDEGLISRFRGRGTFVNERPVTPTWCELETNWDGLLANRDGSAIKILGDTPSVSLPGMEYPIGEPVKSYRHLLRHHSRNGEPYLVADLYVDTDMADRIDDSAFKTTSAMRIASDIPKMKIADVRQIMTIGIADLELSDQLDIALNSPVFHVDRFITDKRGRLVVISKGTYRGDIIKLDFKVR